MNRKTTKTKSSNGGHPLVVRNVLLAGLAVIFLCTPAAASEFTVTQWTLGVLADPPGYDDGFSVFTTVANPFSDSHTAFVNETIASSSYDFAWDGTFGRFLIGCENQSEDLGDWGWSKSAGTIFLSTTVDLLITIHGEYTYNLPGRYMDADMKLAVYSTDPPVSYFDDYQTADTAWHPVASGTFLSDGQTTLPAGGTYRLKYRLEVDCAGYQPGQIATGSGNVSFTIQAVPEPGTLSLALLGSMMLLRRRRQQRKASTNTLPKGIR